MLALTDCFLEGLRTQRPSATLVASPQEPDMDREWTRKAFSSHVEAQLDALWGAALRLTRNATDADDLVAESVSKAWSAIESLYDWERFRPWIFRIMRNHFISGYRRDQRSPNFVRLDAPADPSDGGDLCSFLNAQPDAFLQWWANPEKRFADKLLGEQIIAAIEALPEVFRTTIMLVNVDGLRYDEAAELLGVPPGTVRSRMKRGRTLLQKALWEQGRSSGLLQDREASQ